MFFLTALCCVCLSKVNKSPDIIYKNNFEQMKKKLQFCFGGTELNNDVLQNICNECNDRLEKYCEFKHLYRNSQTQLKHYLSYLSPGNSEAHGNLHVLLQNISRYTYNDDNSTAFGSTNKENEHFDEMFTENKILCCESDLSLNIDKVDFTDTCEYDLNNMLHVKHKEVILARDLDLYNEKEYKKMINDPWAYHCEDDAEEHSFIVKTEHCVDIEYNSVHVGVESGESLIKKENIDHIKDDMLNCNSDGAMATEDVSGCIRDDVICSVNEDGTRDFIAETRGFYNKKDLSLNSCNYKVISTNEIEENERCRIVDEPHSCDICNLKFSRSSELKQHKQTHNSEKPYSCDMCAYKSVHRRFLVQHKKNHTVEKRFYCDVCDYKSNVPYHFKRHKMIHTNEKPLACDICTYRCYEKPDLKRHKLIHIDEKPFSCEMCSYKCRSSSRMKHHKAVHTGEKRFACDVCDSKFYMNDNLQKHKKIHSTEKPFSCDICSFKCRTNFCMKRHKMIHRR